MLVQHGRVLLLSDRYCPDNRDRGHAAPCVRYDYDVFFVVDGSFLPLAATARCRDPQDGMKHQCIVEATHEYLPSLGFPLTVPFHLPFAMHPQTLVPDMPMSWLMHSDRSYSGGHAAPGVRYGAR